MFSTLLIAIKINLSKVFHGGIRIDVTRILNLYYNNTQPFQKGSIDFKEIQNAFVLLD